MLCKNKVIDGKEPMSNICRIPLLLRAPPFNANSRDGTKGNVEVCTYDNRDTSAAASNGGGDSGKEGLPKVKRMSRMVEVNPNYVGGGVRVANGKVKEAGGRCDDLDVYVGSILAPLWL